MISTVTEPILLIATGFVALGMLWKTVRSRENRVWHAIGATGWGLLALSVFTDGFVQIGILGIGLLVFVAAIVLQRRGLIGRSST